MVASTAGPIVVKGLLLDMGCPVQLAAVPTGDQDRLSAQLDMVVFAQGFLRHRTGLHRSFSVRCLDRGSLFCCVSDRVTDTLDRLLLIALLGQSFFLEPIL